MNREHYMEEKDIPASELEDVKRVFDDYDLKISFLADRGKVYFTIYYLSHQDHQLIKFSNNVSREEGVRDKHYVFLSVLTIKETIYKIRLFEDRFAKINKNGELEVDTLKLKINKEI